MLRSLRSRLILTYVALVGIGFGLLALIAGQQISSAALIDYERGLDTQILLIANAVAGPVSGIRDGEAREAELSQLLQRFGQQTGARITIINAQGKAWADSSGVLPRETQTAFPEVSAAMAGNSTREIRADDQGVQTYFLGAPIHSDEGVIGVVRLSAPAQAATTLIMRRWLTLAGGAGVVFVLGLIASLALSASLARPLEYLRQSGMRLAEGDFSQRVAERGPEEVRQLASTFNYLAAQVQAMLDEQRAFASNASHELRTPLTTIRLRSEALRGGQLNEEVTRQYIAEIDDEAVRLSALVEDLILLSRLETGRVQITDEWIEPVRFARRLLHELEPAAAAHGVSLSLDAPEKTEPMQVSLNHLRVVFRNLLDNAMKYTPAEGSVTWKMRCDGDLLVSEVIDTGIGVSAEDLPRLFQRFYRADKAHGRTMPGVGLGLALARSVVMFYGGDIDISSAGPGKGTTVSVRWPMRQPPAPKIPPSR